MNKPDFSKYQYPFRIPISFKLGGQTIQIKKVDKCSDAQPDCDGQACYAKSLIELKQDKEFSDDYKEWVYLHELFHFLFNNIEEYDLRKNEKIVSLLATSLHQVLKTAVYQDEK